MVFNIHTLVIIDSSIIDCIGGMQLLACLLCRVQSLNRTFHFQQCPISSFMIIDTVDTVDTVAWFDAKSASIDYISLYYT